MLNLRNASQIDADLETLDHIVAAMVRAATELLTLIDHELATHRALEDSGSE